MRCASRKRAGAPIVGRNDCPHPQRAVAAVLPTAPLACVLYRRPYSTSATGWLSGLQTPFEKEGAPARGGLCIAQRAAGGIGDVPDLETGEERVLSSTTSAAHALERSSAIRRATSGLSRTNRGASAAARSLHACGTARSPPGSANPRTRSAGHDFRWRRSPARACRPSIRGRHQVLGKSDTPLSGIDIRTSCVLRHAGMRRASSNGQGLVDATGTRATRQRNFSSAEEIAILQARQTGSESSGIAPPRRVRAIAQNFGDVDVCDFGVDGAADLQAPVRARS